MAKTLEAFHDAPSAEERPPSTARKSKAKAKPTAAPGKSKKAAETPPTTSPAPTRRRRTLIVKAPDSQGPLIELRKAVEVITIRNVSNSSGEITVLQRRAFNAMLHIAQKARAAGAPDEKVTFEVSIAEFENLVGHTSSNNREHLKQMVKALLGIQVEFDFKGSLKGKKSSWGVANLISEVYLTENDHSIKFSFPSEFAKRLLDPTIYNRIDLAMQNVFTSHSALALYEHTSRYWGSEYPETFRAHWPDWSVLLSGATEPHAQFRDFNKMLSRAVEQVNTLEPRFTVTPHVSKRGRKVDQMWFVLTPKNQGELGLTGQAPIVSEEVQKRLAVFGMDEPEIARIAIKYDEEYILAHADYTDRRMKKAKDEPLKNPAAFFVSCLENNYASVPVNTGSRTILGAKPSPGTAPDNSPPPLIGVGAGNTGGVTRSPVVGAVLKRAKEIWKKAKLDEISLAFHSQTEDKRNEIIQDILPELEKLPAVWKKYKQTGVESKLVAATLFELIFKKFAREEPTPEELVHIALENGLMEAKGA